MENERQRKRDKLKKIASKGASLFRRASMATTASKTNQDKANVGKGLFLKHVSSDDIVHGKGLYQKYSSSGL